MFYHIRYQTGEIDDVIKEMKKGSIPCMDVQDYDELGWVLEKLKSKGIYRIDGMPYDRDARDRLKEPEFEFRMAFSENSNGKPMYIDFYFEPDVEETYDSIGEI
ncbi:MAG: hypothetical protein N2489_06090 [Clostridia bacterium]|nr:hypothetical protein [Clostridia bacterium]